MSKGKGRAGTQVTSQRKGEEQTKARSRRQRTTGLAIRSTTILSHDSRIVHIRITATTSLSLNCLIHGEVQEQMFTVKILKTENVSILKDLIKEKKASRLEHVDASDLDLFQVSLPKGGNVDAILQNTQPLDSLLPLSRGFPSVEENYLHVVVRAPINGELIWAESDSLIGIVQRVLRPQEKRRGEIRSALCGKVCTFSFFLAVFD